MLWNSPEDDDDLVQGLMPRDAAEGVVLCVVLGVDESVAVLLQVQGLGRARVVSEARGSGLTRKIVISVK